MRTALAAALMLISVSAAAQDGALPLPPSPSAAAPQTAIGALPLPGLAPPMQDLAPPTRAPAPAITPLTAARPTAPAAPGASRPEPSLLDELNLPGLVKLVLTGDLEAVPDDRLTRRFVFSLYGGIAQVCGAPGDQMSLIALGYVEPRMAPGRDVAQFGMEAGLEQLLALSKAMQTGDVRDLVAAGSVANYENAEGISDGMFVATAFGCSGAELLKLRRAIETVIQRRSGAPMQPDDFTVYTGWMSVATRARLNLRDPSEELTRRQVRASAATFGKACAARYEPTSFCDCLVEDMSKADLAAEDWRGLAATFDEIVGLSGREPSVRAIVKSCISETL